MSRPAADRPSCIWAVIAAAVAACAQGEPPDGLPADRADAAAVDARTIDADVSAPDADDDEPDAADDAPDAPAADAAAIDARADAAPDAAVPDAAPAPDADPAGAVLYACNESDLYRVDPATLTATRVAAFGWPGTVGIDAMADLAVAGDGALFGASASRLYRIDPATARATVVGALGQAVNALAFVPAGVVDSAETLVGATQGGAWLRIDATTGAITSLGHFSAGHSSSGDLAYVPSLGVVAAVNPGGANDVLARVNPATGATTPIGATTGVIQLWGLGFAGGRLVGFALAGGISTIDTASGTATPATSGPAQWYGAAGK
jgi:hypothetical protein